MIEERGFTLIEILMVVAIIAIISVSGAYLMIYLVQNSIFIPNKLNMDMVASDALGIMIEGDDSAKGLRFSKSVTNIQDNRLTFNNQDDEEIVYRLNTGTNELHRSIGNGPWGLIPYYVSTGINISGTGNKLFTYYDENDNEINPAGGDPDDVRRIKITLIAETGTGSFSDWEGQSEKSSSITVRKFE